MAKCSVSLTKERLFIVGEEGEGAMAEKLEILALFGLVMADDDKEEELPIALSPAEAAEAKIRVITDENTISPVASLKLASNSINVESCFGTLILLNISITIAGSVGAIKAANVKATAKGR
jgi:hypothetical protein